MEDHRQQSLMRKVDCVEFYVPDLEAGLAFYRDKLGHQLLWRMERTAGLRLSDSDSEIVIQNERREQAVDFQVNSADEAAQAIQEAGGTVIVAPFDIQIGRCAVVSDPWGNRFVLLDISKGLLKTDSDHNVIGNLPV
jgi:lactoylglutathione lyase